MTLVYVWYILFCLSKLETFCASDNDHYTNGVETQRGFTVHFTIESMVVCIEINKTIASFIFIVVNIFFPD